MKIVIIEDESRARNLLQNILREKCTDINAVYEAANLKDGVKIIKKENPDLVFLDIEMPQESGIHILDYFVEDKINFELVFTTAYSQYALQAFEMNAIDYILKPLRPDKVKKAVERVKNNSQKKILRKKLEELREALKNKTFNKIGIPDKEGTSFVPLKEIICIEADGGYCKIHTQKDGIKIISKSMKFFDPFIEKHQYFLRIHRSYIINVHLVKRLIKKDGLQVVLENDTIALISRDKKNELLQIISNNL